MSYHIEAIYENGVFRPDVPVNIPNGKRVSLEVDTTQDDRITITPPQTASFMSPRLVHPEQAVEFQMEVCEVRDAGV